MQVVRTAVFDAWLKALPDRRVQARIARRLDQLASDNAGDVRPVGEGVSELRIHLGPGYRVYYVRRGRALLVVLWGGDKASQARDIDRAKKLASRWEPDDGA